METSEEKKKFIPISSLDTSFQAIQINPNKEPQSLRSNKTIPIKLLLKSVQSTNKHALPKNLGLSIAEEIPTTATTQSFTSRVQEVLKVRIPKLQTTRANSNLNSSPSQKKDFQEILTPNARDKGLKDIENYRNIRSKGFPSVVKNASVISKNMPHIVSPMKKSSSMTQSSLISLVKKREGLGSIEPKSSIIGFAENASTAFSIDSPQKENDGTPYTLKRKYLNLCFVTDI